MKDSGTGVAERPAPVVYIRVDRLEQLLSDCKNDAGRARHLGISHPVLSRILDQRDRYRPSAQTIAAIRSAFPQVSWDDLFDIRSDETRP